MKFIISFCTFFSFASFAQTVNYNDVGVIVNDNSQESIDIADYFQNARNIPAQNMIHISAPTSEDIDGVQFGQIRSQIENYLISNSLEDSLNYLVTTKGVPLKLYNYSDCVQNPTPGMNCGSFDSDLALILGSYSSSIGNAGHVPNPYKFADTNFTRATYGIYLVTRLDGYTKQDVFNLIDNSGPNTGLDQQMDLAVLDMNNTLGGGDSLYFANEVLQPAYDTLTSGLWNAIVDYNLPQITNQNNVFAYLSTGHGPYNSTNLNYSWTQGAFSSLSTCNTAQTFDASLNTSNNFLLANLIAQGCTAAHGYVNCIYFGQILPLDVFVDRYLDPIKNYNLAESYYMAESTLSWQTVIIGDPKASVYINNPASVSTYEKDFIKIFPNPTSDHFKIIGINELSGDVSLSITSIDGTIIEMDNEIQEGKFYQLTASGVYFVNVYSNGEHIGTYRIIKQ
jgi:uncharacterized protein (TIGR03790 family)